MSNARTSTAEADATKGRELPIKPRFRTTRWSMAAALGFTLVMATTTACTGPHVAPGVASQRADGQGTPTDSSDSDLVGGAVVKDTPTGQIQKAGFFSEDTAVDGVVLDKPPADARLIGDDYTATVIAVAHTGRLATRPLAMLPAAGEQFTVATISIEDPPAGLPSNPIAVARPEPKFAIEVDGARHELRAAGSRPMRVTVVVSAPETARRVALRGSEQFTDQTLSLTDFAREDDPKVLYRKNRNALVNKTIDVPWTNYHGKCGICTASGVVSVYVKQATLWNHVGGVRASSPDKALLTLTSDGAVSQGSWGLTHYTDFEHAAPEHVQLQLPDGTQVTPKFLNAEAKFGWLSGNPVWEVPADFTTGTLNLTPDGNYTGSTGQAEIKIGAT